MPNNRIRQIAVGSASALALSVGFAIGFSTSAAAAPTEIYSGGATLPGAVYRKLFNCWGQPVDVGGKYISPKCTAPVGVGVIFGYAPVGSGGGQSAFIFDDTTKLGVPSALNNTVPYSNSQPPVPNNPVLPAGTLAFSSVAPTGFAKHHFSGSDAIITQSNPTAPTISFDCYNGVAVDPSCTIDRRTVAGPAIQVPTVATTVSLPFRVTGIGGLNLSEQSLCGIFTGNITKWNAASIIADNPGKALPNQIIRVVVRADKSGTTFLFANHLEAVCNGVRTPSDWTGGVGTAVTWSNPFFYKATGNEGVAQVVAATDFSIGYTTPELTKPAVITITALATFTLNDGNGLNPVTVNAGNYPARPRAALANKLGAFILPTSGTALTAMGSATPPVGAAALDAANWGLAGLVPDPNKAGSYPISGFTWFNGYTCYAGASVGTNLRNFFGWFLVPAGDPVEIVKADTFGALPAVWRNAVRKLVVGTKTTKISSPAEAVGTRNPVCTGKLGAGA